MSIRNKLFRYRTLFCLIMSVVLFFSGVCFEQIKVQSFFTYNSENHQDAFVNDAGVKLVTSCSNETLGLRNTKSTTNGARLLLGRRTLRTVVLDVLPVEQFIGISIFSSLAQLLSTDEENQGAEVVLFIHKSDGKKRA